MCPDQPWRNIRGLGNWLRHQYDRIDLRMIWETLDELRLLRASVSAALTRLETPPDDPKPPSAG